MKNANLLSVILAGGCALAASAATDVPAYTDMPGNYIIMNYLESDEVEYLKEVRSFAAYEDTDNKLTFNNFYMKSGLPFDATYNSSSGTIQIAAGTQMFGYSDGVGSQQFLYNWDETAQEVTERPISYRYKGNNTWECSTPLVLMTGTAGGDLTPYYFSVRSRIVRSNATTNNVSYVYDGVDTDTQTWVENRPSYVEFTDDNKYVTVYNLLSIDAQLYGCWIKLSYIESMGLYSSLPVVIADATNNFDYPYKSLAGCFFNEETKMPTGPTYPGKALEGAIEVTLDRTSGVLDFHPVAIFPTAYDSTTGVATVSYDSYYEMVGTLNVTFEPSLLGSVSVPTADTASEVKSVEYFDLNGRALPSPLPNTLTIRRTTYTDGTSTSTKILPR